MWETLVWWRRLDQEPAAESIRWLREETLRFLLRVALAGFLAWHVLGLLFRSGPDLPTEAIVRAWLLAGVVVAGLGAATLAAEHRWRIAPALFLGTSLVAVTAAIWLLEAPAAANLYPLVSLAAVVLLHPLAGLATAAAGASLLAGLRALVPSLGLPDALPVEAGWLALLTVVVAWALGRNLVLAVEWSVRSSRAAERHAAEARANRAELVQALKQLDHAYYRLQRANAALELAWKAAEEAERARAEFVTNISHELRTPLNLIAGFSELVLTSPESYAEELPPSYRGDLQAIYRSAQHLLTLTNDVIDLARVGMGRLALVREPVDLASVISDACAIVREYIAAKGLGLRVEVAPDLPTLTIDRLRIRQVLLNLLTNAARFTERGEITVAADREGEEVRVEVRDTGRGMAPEALERVFEEFEHEPGQHPRLPGGFGGVGLGLPLSRRFVELHGGRMGAASTLGAGSTFWFTLPTTSPEPSHLAPARPRRGAVSPSTAERVVVLACADVDLREFLQRHLAGFRVVAAENLTCAAALAVEERACAILADEAPDDDEGEPAASALPAPLLRLPLPRGDRVARSLGATAYLVKPITRARLAAVLARLPRPPGTVLIADDDPRFVRLLTRMLEATPFPARPTILIAYNGREALDRLASVTPDLVLLDLAMPGPAGDEVLAAMRATPRLAKVPVILVSARDQIEAQAPLHGAVTLSRPEGFGLEELLGVVEALLGALLPPRPQSSFPLALPAR